MICTDTRLIEPADRIRELYRLVDAGDLDGLAVLFAEDASYARPGYAVLAGRTAIDRFYRQDRVIASGQHTLDSVLTSGDEVTVRGSFTGLLWDGRPVAHRFAEFFTLNRARQVVTRRPSACTTRRSSSRA